MIDQGILSSLSHGAITNLKKGIINNHDAALLIMASTPGGASKTRDVISSLRAWRGVNYLEFVYLFNTSDYGGYGFVGSSVESVSNKVYHLPNRGGFDSTTQRRTYWYRAARGSYRVTLEGFRRLAELSNQLS